MSTENTDAVLAEAAEKAAEGEALSPEELDEAVEEGLQADGK